MSLPVISETTKLLLPQEIEVWYVLPTIRREFALAMIHTGLSQKKVAQLIGVTEAAISNYKKEKRAREFAFDAELKEAVHKSVQRIVHNKSTFFSELMKINSCMKQSGLFCRIHRAKSWTPQGCEAVCAQHFFEGNHGH